MRIIIPCDQSDNILRETAENFSRPYSNGYDPIMHTNYPIYEDGSVPDHIFGNNLILLDYNYSNSYAQKLKDKLIVNYDESGFAYKEQRMDGDYVAMQVIASPYNPHFSILVISTNNKALLRKNFFTRKVILPYYANGIHPYWNNEVLIFTGNHYYGIYEKDGDLESIE